MDDFSAFSRNAGFNHSGLLVLKESYYGMERAFNLDALSISKCHGSKDFFNGIIKDSGRWISINSKEESISPFLQLFHSSFLEIIENIFFLKFKLNEDDYIFFIIKSIDDNFSKILIPEPQIIYDFIKLLSIKNTKSENINFLKNDFFSYEIDFYKICENFIKSLNIKNDFLKNTILNSLNNEILELLIYKFGKENSYFINNKNSKKIVFLSKYKINENLLKESILETTNNLLPYNLFNIKFIKLL